MSYLFSDLDFVKVCLDDVLTHSNNNEEDHMDKIAIAMEPLQAHNLKVKVSKYEFLQKSESYLGHEITESGLCPQKNKIEDMLQMEPPATKKLLQDFLGMFNSYYRLSPTRKIIT